MSCINIYHPDYIKLLSEIDDSIIPFELPTLIRLYQKMNNTDKIPSVSEIYEIDNRTKSQEIPNQIQEVFNENTELANAVYEALGFKQKYEGTEKGNLINELKQITDSYLKEFADLFIQFNVDIPLYYSKGNDYAYVVPDNTLIISKSSTGVIKQKSIIHEVLHGGTSNNLLSNSDFKNRIESIINDIKKSDQQGRITFSYELQSADEFISGLADKAFGTYLKRNGVFDEVLTILKDNISFEKGFKVTPQQKQQAQQLYSKYLESLNKPNTNPILQGNQTNIEEIITQLEKEGVLEIDCKGKLKAEKGLATSFVKGGKWKVIKDLKGYPTHKEGGVDLTIGKNGVSIKNGNTQFTAKHGLVIPKN